MRMNEEVDSFKNGNFKHFNSEPVTKIFFMFFLLHVIKRELNSNKRIIMTFLTETVLTIFLA